LLAVTSGQRVAAVPEVPTVAEACDLPGFDSTTWYALMAPARTPPAILNRLTEVFTRVANEPEVRERISAMGFTPNVQPPEVTRQRLARDIATWREVVARTGARAE
ncbi:MAG: transporter, partial [Rubritepida sp.]|nr:transporter [Rubritepida sp.]